jgi:hypothetical protein
MCGCLRSASFSEHNTWGAIFLSKMIKSWVFDLIHPPYPSIYALKCHQWSTITPPIASSSGPYELSKSSGSATTFPCSIRWCDARLSVIQRRATINTLALWLASKSYNSCYCIQGADNYVSNFPASHKLKKWAIFKATMTSSSGKQLSLTSSWTLPTMPTEPSNTVRPCRATLSPRKSAQQKRNRRKMGLMKKAYEYR